MGEGVSNKDYGKVLDGAIAILGKINPTMKSDNTLVSLQRFGSFMVNILSATKSDDVASALDELIPQNQYQLKNTKNFTISISAYPGVIGGMEWIKKYQTASTGAVDFTLPKKSTSAWTFAPYLPIGIDFNLGHKDSSSTSFFLQVADLGAVLNYRITGSDTSTSTNPNITLKQLLAPGLGIIHHFRKSPLTFGLEASLTPSLRSIRQDGVTYDPNAFRMGAFIGVDVTGVLLYISKKNIVK
jgi:hypothetical protein